MLSPNSSLNIGFKVCPGTHRFEMLHLSFRFLQFNGVKQSDVCVGGTNKKNFNSKL